MLKHPPDILITTPESLYLMLTSSAAGLLRTVRWVIVDEIHSIAATKRGTHLALTLERLEEVTAVPPQRIGLSATQRPSIASPPFGGGVSAPAAGSARYGLSMPPGQAARCRDRGAARGHDFA
jgi:ATP-dependent Lhr-like helicase